MLQNDHNSAKVQTHKSQLSSTKHHYSFKDIRQCEHYYEISFQHVIMMPRQYNGYSNVLRSKRSWFHSRSSLYFHTATWAADSHVCACHVLLYHSFFTEQRNSDTLQLGNNCSYRTALVIKYRVIVKFVMHNVYNSPTILLEIT